MNKNRIQKNKGFTVMETLAAIFILLISITGPLAFSQSGLRAAFVSRDQVSAFFLAQDAIEYIKNVRDNNVIDDLGGIDTDWLYGLGDCMVSDPSEPGCSIDTHREVIESCSSLSVPGCIDESTYTPLTRNELGNKYIGTNATPPKQNTIYARNIKIEEIQSDVEAAITVIIQWDTHEQIGKREIIVRENIYNWASL